MQITAKIKFGSGKQKVESFGNSRFLVYLMSKIEEDDAMEEFGILMARYLGVPPARIQYKGKQGENHVFEVN